MKCGKCGYRANGIKGMGAHYRKKHPGALKRHRRTPKATRSPRRAGRAVSATPREARATDLECAIQTVRANGGSVTFGTG